MSQFDFGTIDANTKTGTQLADDLSGTDKWRDALNSNHSGIARPSYAVQGMIWIDTDNFPIALLKMYTGTDDIVIDKMNFTELYHYEDVSGWDVEVSYSFHDYVKGSDANLYASIVVGIDTNSGNDPTVSPVEWEQKTFAAGAGVNDFLKAWGSIDVVFSQQLGAEVSPNISGLNIIGVGNASILFNPILPSATYSVTLGLRATAAASLVTERYFCRVANRTQSSCQIQTFIQQGSLGGTTATDLAYSFMITHA